MAIDSLLIERPVAFANLPENSYAGCIMQIPNLANDAGGGAGQAVTVSVEVSGDPGLPEDYSVLVTPDQACAVHWENKTSTGFDVVLTPLSGSATISAGFIDVTVLYQRSFG